MTVDLRARLAAEGLVASTWSNGAGDRYPAHRHDFDKVLVVDQGSIVFGLSERGMSVEIHAGDRLDLPAGTLHDAVVGLAGVVCLEAHLARGALGPEPRRLSAWARGMETAATRAS
jgi:uncharacterized protein YjlB